MDENKLTKLKEIGYVVYRTCGTCRFANFTGLNDFSVCSKHDYSHLKHTEMRSLSVNINGSCPSYEPDAKRLAKLHGFVDLIV